jgi:hypothetical protein
MEGRKRNGWKKKEAEIKKNGKKKERKKGRRMGERTEREGRKNKMK